MRKNILILSIICLFAITLSYTYSAFKKTIKGTITATTNNLKFSVNVTSGVKEKDYYKVPINNTSGSFNIVLDNTNSKYIAKYIIDLELVDLPNDIVSELNYEGILNKTSKTITINYSSTNISNGYIKVKTKAMKMEELAIMKNGSTSNSEFWSSSYKTNITTITFNNDLTILPSTCTSSNNCWDITDSSSEKDVYGYLNNGNLYIVSEAIIQAPTDCERMFFGFSNVESINLNNNFLTSNITNMNSMFNGCRALTSLDLSHFDTSNVTNMMGMFYSCYVITSINVSNFDTSNVTDMSYMFDNCAHLETLDISNFNISNVTTMNSMFEQCSNIETLKLFDFNSQKLTNVGYMFYSCRSLKIEINIMTTSITNYNAMFNYAATDSGSQITVNYIAGASTLVDNMIATKTSNNVIKGNQINI